MLCISDFLAGPCLSSYEPILGERQLILECPIEMNVRDVADAMGDGDEEEWGEEEHIEASDDEDGGENRQCLSQSYFERTYESEAEGDQEPIQIAKDSRDDYVWIAKTTLPGLARGGLLVRH